MILNDIKMAHEGNKLEVKQAKGGVPRSIWATYSSFANSDGGLILLGVVEKTNKDLIFVGVDNPEELVKDFWDTVNNPNKVNLNILSPDDVSILKTDGKEIIAISVPRAKRQQKPIYIDNNLLSGTYRRNGEGDYHCQKDEINDMLRDQKSESDDLRIAENATLESICDDTLKKYRHSLESYHPGHQWASLPKEEFLIKLGAAIRDKKTKEIHITGAGLLMFGYDYEIVREYPQYFLDYREINENDERWSDRVISSSGDWSGNLLDFHWIVSQKLQLHLKTPFKMKNGIRIDDTPMHKGIREALANSLIHAQFHGRQGLVILYRPEIVEIANPGCLRCSPEQALSGGFSDPRNTTVFKIFTLIGIGERAGSGLCSIMKAWKDAKYQSPTIEERFDPERTILRLPLIAIKQADEPLQYNSLSKKETVLNYIKTHTKTSRIEISKATKIAPRTLDRVLKELKEENLITNTRAGNRLFWNVP